ncbi:MAG: hypoxanthine phosphoribosyltransferase, partial [Syntrophomonadaceae bacterium]|nr:hypoxanthine phosphoribosyltransferase [Syntrophomonadaceae bacterium]
MPETKLGKIIYTEADIQQKIVHIAELINRDYAGKKLIIIGVLKGSLYFIADLTRHLTVPINIDFISIGTSPEELNITGGVRFT